MPDCVRIQQHDQRRTVEQQTVRSNNRSFGCEYGAGISCYQQTRGREKMNQLFRVILLFYFISHIPITLCVDLQVLFGEFYPDSLQNLNNWYIATYKDFVIRDKPLWLQSFIWCELFLQMPFFFVATYGLLFKKNFIRIPSIFYGVHVATTVVPILAETLLNDVNTFNEKLMLSGFYLPYLLIPLSLALYMAAVDTPFPDKKPKKI